MITGYSCIPTRLFVMFAQAIKTMDDECERTRRRREESQTVKQELQQSLATLQGMCLLVISGDRKSATPQTHTVHSGGGGLKIIVKTALYILGSLGEYTLKKFTFQCALPFPLCTVLSLFADKVHCVWLPSIHTLQTT